MNGKILAALLCAALLLPLATTAENTVEALPTTAPMPEPAAETNEYAIENLDAYYADGDEYQIPAMTADEKARLADAQNRWDAGERPEESILDVTEKIVVSLVQIPAEQYDGHSWFLFLPCEDLTDGQLLQIVDAFGQLEIRFDPEDLSWRCCMRGGGIETTRSLRDEEFERSKVIREQYMRLGLRPQTPWTAAVADDGIGEVTLDEDSYSGLDSFSFKPARRLTDEELLQLIAAFNPEPAASSDDLSKYEGLLRQELHARLGMPLATVRDGGEYVGAYDRNDSRNVYRAGFTEIGSEGRVWGGALDTQTGKLAWGNTELDKRLFGDTQLQSDVRMDPWDARWTKMAEMTVASLLGEGAPGVVSVQAWGEENLNNVDCIEVRVTMEDNSVCRVFLSYALGKAVMVELYDAAAMALEDEMNSRMLEEGNVNE